MATTAFNELKRNRKQLFEQQQVHAKKTAEDKGYEKDARFWAPTYDKAGRSQALIRFLPPVEGEAAGFVRIYNHYFKGPAGWYRETCLTTIGQKDPVQEMSRRLWDTKNEAVHTKAQEIGRRKQYIANIYVKRDPANPDAEGKVFLYRFPQAVYDMINMAMNGGDDDNALGEDAKAETFEVFSFWGSKDFKLDVYKKGNFPQYDKCGFVGKESDLLMGDDDALNEVWKQQHSLDQFLKPEMFKKPEELRATFLGAMGCRSMEEAFQLLIGGEVATTESVDDEIKSQESKRPAAKAASKTEAAAAAADDKDEDASYLDSLMDATPKGRRK